MPYEDERAPIHLGHLLCVCVGTCVSVRETELIGC